MSGFIHISHETPAWQKAARAGCALAVVSGLAWVALSDEGLPVAPADDAPATPFVKATPLPAHAARNTSPATTHIPPEFTRPRLVFRPE